MLKSGKFLLLIVIATILVKVPVYAEHITANLTIFTSTAQVKLKPDILIGMHAEVWRFGEGTNTGFKKDNMVIEWTNVNFPLTNSWRVAADYIKITYACSSFDEEWGIALYTDNTNSSIAPYPYRGGGNPAGLVSSNGMYVLEMVWQIRGTYVSVAPTISAPKVENGIAYFTNGNYYWAWKYFIDKSSSELTNTASNTNWPATEIDSYNYYAVPVWRYLCQMGGAPSERWQAYPEWYVARIYLGANFAAACVGQTYKAAIVLELFSE